MKLILRIILVVLPFFSVSCGRNKLQEFTKEQIDSLSVTAQAAATEKELAEAVTAMENAYQSVLKSGDEEKQMDILTDLIPLQFRAGIYENALPRIMEAKSIAQRLGNKEKESLFCFYLGMYYMDIGDRQQANRHLEEGIAISSSIKDTDYSVRYMKGNLLAVLFNEGDFRSVIKIGRSIVDTMSPEDLKGKKGDAIYAQVCAMLACSYQVLVNEGEAMPHQQDSASFFADEYYSTFYSDRDHGQKLRNYFIASGQNEKARTLLFGELDEMSSGDTVSLRYYRALKALAGTYESDGQYKDAYDFQSRAISLKDSLDRQNLIEKGLEYEANINNAKNAWEKRRQTQSFRIFSSLFIFSLLVIFVLVLFVVMNIRKSRAIERKNKMLAVSVASGARKDDIIGKLSAKDDVPFDEDLYYFRQIEKTTEDKKLYLDKSITRDILLKEYGVPKGKIPQVLNRYAGVGTLNEYINMKRLNHAATLLVDNKGMKFFDVAQASGFSNTTTMYRLFMRHFDMSPSEYVKRYRSAEDAGELENVNDA